MLSAGIDVSVEMGGSVSPSILRGWKLGKVNYLFLELPAINRLQGLLKPGEEATMRIRYQGKLSGIAGIYLTFLKRTNLHLFSFSDDVMTASPRNHERYQCMMRAEVVNEKGDLILAEGMITDISMGGLKLFSDQDTDTEQGGLMYLNIYLPTGEKINRQAIQLVRAINNGGLHFYACMFNKLRPDNSPQLERFFDIYREWELAQEAE